MNILALDTSSRAASCAIWRDGSLVGEFYANMGLTHSQTAMPMVEALLRLAELAPKDLDFIAVTTGPGSFTGLRIGISLAKGMALAADKPCIPVPTLEALAENLVGAPGLIIPAMDARRGQVYTAAFQSGEDAASRLWEDAALSVEELGAQAAQLSCPAVLVGDGAELCYRALADKVELLQLAPEHLRHQRAGSAARVAARMAAKGCCCTAGELAPTYLRLPQAERERLEKLQAEGKR